MPLKVEINKYYRCIGSKSNAYKYDHLYKGVLIDGKKGLVGSDGLFDEGSQLVSVFEQLKDNDKRIPGNELQETVSEAP